MTLEKALTQLTDDYKAAINANSRTALIDVQVDQVESDPTALLAIVTVSHGKYITATFNDPLAELDSRRYELEESITSTLVSSATKTATERATAAWSMAETVH